MANMLEKDWSKSTDAELELELQLCKEVLYGKKFCDGQQVHKLIGLEDPAYASNTYYDTFHRAKKIWRQRLKNVQDELFERKLLRKEN